LTTDADRRPLPLGTGPKLSLSTKLFYGFGSVAYGVKDQGFSYLLLIFYNQVVGLPAQTVGLAIMIALAFDALLDPIVGQVSDNWRSPWGRRHPFMYAAALPVAISYLLLWNPPDWSQDGVFYYLIGVAVVIRTFITFYEIPSAALGAELTTDYDERTTVMSYRYFFGWIGGITMTLLALKVFLQPDAEHAVGQLNPSGYASYGLAASAIMLAAILISAMGTHRHVARLSVPAKREWSLGSLAREMLATLSHRSFLMLLLTGLFNAMAQGLVLSLSLYFNTYFWNLTTGQIAFFVVGNIASAGLAFAFATPLSKLGGKKLTAILCKIIAFGIGVGPIGLRLLGLFPENGHPIIVPVLFAQTVFGTAFSIVSSILITSMIADVVEDSQLKTGRRSEGLFFSAAAFVAKAVSGVGIFASGLILLAVHFPAKAQPGQVSEAVIRDLGVVYLAILAAMYGAAIFLMSQYRITREGHAETIRRLAAEAEHLAEPGSPETERGGAA
jgi:Na+/melibiose symporter-like transporter